MLTILCLIGVTSAATTLISENYVSKSGVAPILKVVVNEKLSDRFSFFAVGSASSGYGEVRAGPVWVPNTNFSFGISAGVEVTNHPWILAGTVTGRLGRLSAFGVLERGGEYGFWREERLTVDLGEGIGVGIIDQTGAGIGPRIVYDQKHFGFWVAPMYEMSDHRVGGLITITVSP